MKRLMLIVLIVAMTALMVAAAPVAAASPSRTLGVNVLLNTAISDKILAELGTKGTVLDVMTQINALTMRIKSNNIAAVKALPYVVSVNEDAVRNGAPIDTVAVDNFASGMSTWNLDAINVTDFGSTTRTVDEDGTGVYVAVLDTGLLDSWRQYFPEDRIAVEYAKSFGGGGGINGNVSEQPNKWEHDQNSHGTHVTSTILGYNLRGTAINGVAPMATIIPVKVLNQNGSGWSSVIARGIVYIADLKADELDGAPVVINMSLGGSALDPVEKAAIDYAISKGVIIVASAGNEGDAGMGYPGAYEPVISVAAAGWDNAGLIPTWWYGLDVADPTNPADFFIADFSSIELSAKDQDLDITAPGSAIVGPYQVNSGKTSYYYLSGTSMASPHVAGLVALMAQKSPGLSASSAESFLENNAIDMETTGHDIYSGYGLVDAFAALDAIP